MSGRGAWPVSGLGGTKAYKDKAKPGPYYYLGSGFKTSADTRTINEYAVYRAVISYQQAVNRRISAGLVLDGHYGPSTHDAIWTFQESLETVAPWGGIGPSTSKQLLLPDIPPADNKQITTTIVSGVVNTESMWDAGAVGFADDRDLGLAQINGAAHPDLSMTQRLRPLTSFLFINSYLNNAFVALDGNIRDAIASYNLGLGGVSSWIKAGRPDLWTPVGQSTPRNVKAYIDKILAG